MNRLTLGIGLGVVFGAIDVLISLAGNHPDRSTAVLAQAFTSRFAIGVLGANVQLRTRWRRCRITGSLPDAFGINSYIGVVGSGLVFGAAAGWATKQWAK